MHQLIDEQNGRETLQSRKRSVFHIYLCVMTWLGCGFLLWSYTHYFVLAYDVSRFTIYSGIIDWSFFWKMVIGTFATVMSLSGSIFFFMKRRTGFYLYVPGQLILLLSAAYPPFIFDLQMRIPAAYILVTIVLSIAFIFLYRRVLKQY